MKLQSGKANLHQSSFSHITLACWACHARLLLGTGLGEQNLAAETKTGGCERNRLAQDRDWLRRLLPAGPLSGCSRQGNDDGRLA